MENKSGAPMLMFANYLHKKRDENSILCDCESLAALFNHRTDYGDSKKYQMGNGYFTVDGIAVVPVMSPMMKGSRYYSDQSKLTALMQELKADSSVKGVLNVFDSPGGSVAGTSDYGDSIADLSISKPCIAYCQDMCASAAYWAASQCSKVFSNSTALVGSIGVISALVDASKLYEDMGVKVIPLVTGKFKGAGDESQPATAETVDYMQGIVDDLYEPFLSAVNKGRGISKTAIKGMEAAVFIGQKAVDNGLVDKICTLEEAFNTVSRMANKNSGVKSKAVYALEKARFEI